MCVVFRHISWHIDLVSFTRWYVLMYSHMHRGIWIPLACPLHVFDLFKHLHYFKIKVWMPKHLLSQLFYVFIDYIFFYVVVFKVLLNYSYSLYILGYWHCSPQLIHFSLQFFFGHFFPKHNIYVALLGPNFFPCVFSVKEARNTHETPILPILSS